MQKLQLAIIGSGPAGLTAGLYASRARIQATLFAGNEIGGQLMYTTEVENFPGFPDGKPGPQLMMDMQKQATRFGTEVKYEQITAVDFSKKPFALWTNLPEGMDQMQYKTLRGDELQKAMEAIRQAEPAYQAEAVVVATGASSIMLGVPGEREYFGHGLSVCAVCDAAFYKDKKVFVIGGGDSAMEDAMALTRFTNQVTIVHRGDTFRASQIMQERVLNNDKIKVLWKSNLKEIIGNGKAVTSIKVDVDGKLEEIAVDGVFYAIGHRPNSVLFAGQLALDQAGYLELNKSSEAETATSVDGVFAAGDVADHRYRQAIVSAGMGAKAALDAERYLNHA